MSFRNRHSTEHAGASGAQAGRIRQRGLLRLVGIMLVTALTASTLVLLAEPGRHGVRPAAARSRQVRLPRAEVTIEPRGNVISLPRSFLGLSTEYWGVPLFERRLTALTRVLSLLHVPGNGPLVLRIGGDSADHSFWDPRARTVPAWEFKLTPAWLRHTSAVVRRAGVRLILDLNLVTGSPSIAARWASAAERGLPRGSVVGFEVGNEPDIYSHRFWLATVSRSGEHAAFLPASLSAARYTKDFAAYAAALAQVAPGVPLVGPAVANPLTDLGWIRKLLGGAHPGLGAISAHRYPLSACAKPRSRTYPTIARVLSQRATAGIAQSLRGAVALAHRAGLPLRLTELNSVTCGGRPGVSDTFATALWAPDALFEVLRAGVDGVNVHVRSDAINAAFALSRHGLQARPLLYGLIMFARTLGPGAQLVNVRTRAKPALNLKVWAVRVSGDRLHVLLIDKSNHSISVDVRIPASGPATLERLLAPSVRSESGVTLDGRQLGADGLWHGAPENERIVPDEHQYELTLPRMSAALLRVHLAPTGEVSRSARAHAPAT